LTWRLVQKPQGHVAYKKEKQEAKLSLG